MATVKEDVIINVRVNSQNATKNLKHTGDSITTYNRGLFRTVETTQRVIRAGKENIKVLTKTKDSLNRFNMELLGPMFLLQGLSRAMFGLLRPAFEAAGVFELFSAFLEILFLPIALVVLDAIIFIMDIFDKLPGPVKDVIGAITLAIGIFAGLAAIAAAVGLAWQGFIFILGLTTAPVWAVVGAIAAIIAIIALVILAFKNWDKIKEIVGVIWEAIKGFFVNISAKIMGLAPMFKDGFLSIFSAITGVPKKFLEFGVDIISNIIDGVKSKAGEIMTAMFSKMTGLPDWLKKALKSLPGVGKYFNVIPGFATGGIVTQPTLAMVGEKGPERIVPLGQSSAYGASGGGGGMVYSPTININASVSSDMDIRRLAEQLNRYMADNLRRI